MGKLSKYQTLIKKYIKSYTDIPPLTSQPEDHAIFDVLAIGRNGNKHGQLVSN